MKLLIPTLFCLSSLLFADSAKPNVIYILADDLGYGELGCYGQTKIKTPNIDQLSAGGMRFTRHYSGAPVCAPSRGVLLTGKQLSKAFVRNNREHKPEGQAPIPEAGITLAKIFKDQGYATGAFGKWGLGYPGSSSDPKALSFDTFYGYNCQRVAHSFYPPHMWSNDEKIIINEKPVPGHWKKAVGPDFDFSQFYAKNYAPDLILEQALKFISDNKDKPFFAYVPFVEPHLAMHPPHSWVDFYPKEWDQPKKSYNANYLPHLRPRAGYAAMISDLDEHVGSIMSLLKELKLDEKTLVIFSSDNGASHCIEVDHKFFNSNKGLRGLKGSVYEGGLRVPMIAHWPKKIKAGQVSSHVSGFVDVMATMCELLNSDVPESSDGVSFLPELLGGKQKPQPVLAWEFQGYGGQQAIILDGRWKGVRQNLLPRGKKKTSRVPQWELYDLNKDSFEKNDLAKQMPEMVDRIHKAMMANRNESEKFHMPLASQ
ncbi:arylsulfatase [Lentisphaera profundi]|uniref:Arylsulfatase n=1 Tax=Lentisphaera profundi TaxID=1658616 RepID=A0ABY7VUT0_9BACT|nr:arylsulfatase [Lentisphaera profundi]WDE96504.1 arylsulfatase [Lentisphaera profundi]